jgi:SAM-dependent methyltransferase
MTATPVALSNSNQTRYRRVHPKPAIGRLRLLARWGRFATRSIVTGDLDFTFNSLRACGRLLARSVADVALPSARVECNICGWRGRSFYPNTGPGYDEPHTLCPGCRVLDRHRSLLEILTRQTDFFTPGRRIIEVAPMRGFESLCLAQDDLNYTSFDIERHAMERGDITKLHYPDDSADYFICFHVLEHIPHEAKALAEMRRVLKPGGCAVLQVPIDWSIGNTREYDSPDPREVGHVRRYGRDFGERIARHGFNVRAVSVGDCVGDSEVRTFGLSSEPVFLARKPVVATSTNLRLSQA